MASRAPASAAPAHADDVAAPTPSRHRETARVRTALKVSSPGDAAEREAEATARRVVAMPAPLPLTPIARRMPLMPARAPVVPVPRPTPPAAAAPAPAKARPPEETSPELETAIKKELGGGRPLPADVASFMAPRFKANFGAVRIHTDARAANLATRLGANAFTFGRDIFFNAGAFNPETKLGMELIAHELTHTIQQREVVQREAAAEAAPVEVRETSAPKVQRGLISKALDWIADKANYIPGFRLFTIVIGVNPINMSTVERSGANILRALIEFIPGGGLIVEALENHGVFQKGGKFIEEQFRALGMVGSMFRDALMNFLDSLGWSDLFSPGDVWDRAKRIFTEPVKKLIEFGKGLVSGIAAIVKDAILKPLGRFAASVVPKWELLVGVFGKNPISDEGASPASAIIGGFMELIGQGEIWKNIQKGNAVSQAWSWFKGAIAGALALVTSIPGRVMGVIRSLTIFDIVTVAGAFKKILGAFGSFVGDFIRWAGGTVLKLLEIILSVVAPSVVPYLKKAGAAFSTIIKAPGTFIGTLVRAGKLGFNQFSKNILTHLKKGVIDWLLGSLAGANLYIPKSFDLRELLKFGLSVIGLTWANVRAKLVKATNETTVKALEAGFDIVTKLVTEGPAAAWQQLLESLSNLKSMVMDAIMDYVKQKVVEAAIEKVVSMLTPAGAFIQALLAIYRTITFVVSKLAQIGRLVAAFIDGISALARGMVAPAANRIETVLATGLSLAISFLASFAGLGNVSKKVIEIVNKIRAPVDKAIDKVIAWIIDKARKLGKFVAQAGVPHDPNERLRLGLEAGTAAVNRLSGTKVSKGAIVPVLALVRTRYALKSITPVEQGGFWWVEAEVNPRSRRKAEKRAEGAAADPAAAGSWKLAPGGITGQEGAILSGDKGVHLYTKHGKGTVVLELEEETRLAIAAFQQGRTNLIAFYQEQVLSISSAISKKGPKATDARIGEMAENLANMQSLLAFWKAVNPTEREACAAAMQHPSWRSKAGGGPRKVTELRQTRFVNNATLERAVKAALADPEILATIDRQLTASPQRPVRVTHRVGGNLGVGYEMGPRATAVKITAPMSFVTLVARASDEKRRHYMVETAWPHP